MKILHILYSGLGGHGNVFLSMVKADGQKEFEHEALFYGIEEARKEFTAECAKRKINYYLAKKRPGPDPGYYRKIFTLIRESDPDIIMLNGSAYVLLAKISGLFAKKRRKIVVRETQANHLKSMLQWITLAVAMFMADQIVCLTEEFKMQIRKKLGLVYRAKKVVVIPNGIDLEMFKPGPKITRPEFLIGMQSRLVRIKDHLTLLDAFAIIKKKQNFFEKEIKLIIAGDGDYKDTLQKHALALGISESVLFTGMISEEELVVFLQRLDLYVHASLGETMSTAIMQAMACGLPIVASDVSGISNMITGEVTGVLVPPKNAGQLALEIERCFFDDKFRNLIGQNALQLARVKFSNQRMFESYKHIFLGH